MREFRRLSLQSCLIFVMSFLLTAIPEVMAGRIDSIPWPDGLVMTEDGTFGLIKKIYNGSEPFKLVVQSGHSDEVRHIAVSSDGRLLATASPDGTIRLWEAKTGRSIRAINLRKLAVFPVFRVRSLAISPDGLLVAASLGNFDERKTVAWNTISGDIAHTIDGFGRTLVFLDDSRKIFCGSELWDLDDNQVVKTYSHEGKSFNSAALSEDKKLLAAYNDHGNTVHLFDTLKNIWLNKITFKTKTLGLTKVLISVKHDRLFAQLYKENRIRVRKLSTREELPEIGNGAMPMTDMQVYDGGDLLAWGDERGKIGRCSLVSGNYSGPLFAHGGPVRSLAAQYNGDRLWSSHFDQRLRAWSANDNQILFRFGNNDDGVNAVDLSKDGDFMIAGMEKSGLLLWNLKTGKAVRRIKGTSDFVSLAKFSPDGKKIVTVKREKAEDDDYVYRLNVLGLKRDSPVFKFMETHSNGITSADFSSDGEKLVTGSFDSRVILWDMATGRKLREFTHTGPVVEVRFSPGDRYAISGSGSEVRIWNLQTGEVERIIPARGEVRCIAVASAGTQLAVGCAHEDFNRWDECIDIFDWSSGRRVKTLRYGAGTWATALAFSPDNQELVSGHNDHAVNVWKVEVPQPIRVLRYHTGKIRKVAFHPKGALFATGSNDGTIRLWHYRNRTPLVTAIAHERNGSLEWLMSTPDGCFDSSASGYRLAHMVSGLHVYGLDQYAALLNRPDIFLNRLNTSSKDIIDHFKRWHERRLKKSGKKEISPAQGIVPFTVQILEKSQEGKMLDVLLLVENCKDLKRVKVFINDVPVTPESIESSEENENKLRMRLELSAGLNKIEFSALNESGVESPRELIYATGPPAKKQNLYYIGFGVSKYKNHEYNLGYPHKDALDMGEMFSRMKSGFDNVFVKTYIDDQVTKGNILDAKKLLDHASVDDMFVLFIAGHGVYEQKGYPKYYFLTHDSEISNLEKTAVEFECFTDLLKSVKPRKRLFLMDTCESGELDVSDIPQNLLVSLKKGERHRGIRYIKIVNEENDNTPRQRFVLDRDRFIYNDISRNTGATVFSSSKGGEVSYEDEDIENGYFTYALKSAFALENVDMDYDGMVSKNEIYQSVREKVSLMSDGRQNPTIDRDNIYQELRFPLKHNYKELFFDDFDDNRFGWEAERVQCKRKIENGELIFENRSKEGAHYVGQYMSIARDENFLIDLYFEEKKFEDWWGASVMIVCSADNRYVVTITGGHYGNLSYEVVQYKNGKKVLIRKLRELDFGTPQPYRLTLKRRSDKLGILINDKFVEAVDYNGFDVTEAGIVVSGKTVIGIKEMRVRKIEN